MSSGKALICKLGPHQNIEGADRIVQVDMFGETIITQKTNKEGTIGLLFDCETQLSPEYAGANNMFRHSNLNKDKGVTGYMDDNARVKPIKLKGVKCSGLFMPLDSLKPLGIDGDLLLLGQEIDSFVGIPICKKYISPKTQQAMNNNKEGKSKINLAPTFKEHMDTDQWGRNKHKVKTYDLVTITEKLHGTSGRCGYLPTKTELTWWQKFCLFLTDLKWNRGSSQYNFVVGSRRVVKSISGEEAENKEHFYDEDLWTKISKEYFEGKLHKGETVYFEIVGYTPSGELIMGRHSNSKLKPFMDKKEYKVFIDIYGEETRFTYGCVKENIVLPEATTTMLNTDNLYKVFVYRITTTNEDGNSLDYSWEQVKTRCNQLDVLHVPELASYKEGLRLEKEDEITYTERLVNTLTESQSDNFSQHLKEGVCIRIDNGGMTPILLKNKAFLFKALEGIIKENDVIDMEEAN